eukprot:m.117676 g.117676  ORF g.117676 m.117676 type:complete len:238 (-) comp13631_c1_seq1:454-1167(-)
MAATPTPDMTYKAFSFQGIKFRIGEHVIVKSEETTDFVAKIKAVYTDSNSGIHVEVQWYYRPEDLPSKRKPYHAVDELVESNHTDKIPPQTVHCKCRVLTLDEYQAWRQEPIDDVSSELRDLPVYFSRTSYDVTTRKIKARPKPICHCKKPYNPDLPIIMCQTCSKPFHPQCVGLTEEESEAQAASWSCSSCNVDKNQSSSKARAKRNSAAKKTRAKPKRAASAKAATNGSKAAKRR